MTRVLIIGGYGNFGGFISKALGLENNIQLIIAGRSIEKARVLAESAGFAIKPETMFIDINGDLEGALIAARPDITIHTSGPFQSQSYRVAEACIALGSHYIDLADGRSFVEGIAALDQQAKDKAVLVVSGASSVPCLTAALVDHYIKEFRQLEKLDYGITTAQKTSRGLATTAAILSYTGKGFETLIDGKVGTVYGWQSLHAHRYPELGWRLLGNCDVPDLWLFPRRYPDLKTIRFYAGLEIALVHSTLWVLSWLVRLGIVKRLEKAAATLLKISYLFDWLGSSSSAFHMSLEGVDNNGKHKRIDFDLIARDGDGPYVPCMPSILLAKKLAANLINKRGATACVDLITRDEYLNALQTMNIRWSEKGL